MIEVTIILSFTCCSFVSSPTCENTFGVYGIMDEDDAMESSLFTNQTVKIVVAVKAQMNV